MAAKSRKDDSAGGGILFVLAFLAWLVAALLWWILAAALLVAAGFAVRAILRMHEQREQAYAQYSAAMSARADEQLRWADAGDDRGIFGAPRPPLVEPPVPWSTARLATTIGAVVTAALVGAVVLVSQRSLVADDEKPAASRTTSRTASPTQSFGPAPPAYPADFTGQDRQFADQALARGLVKPNSISGLPGFAHGTCNSLSSSVPMLTRIEDPALAWSDAKRQELVGPYSRGSEPLLDLAVDTYCPAVRPAEAGQLSNRPAADTTFINGWYELAGRYRLLYPATAVVMKQAQAVCAALMTAPEWEVVQDVDATSAGNNKDYKRRFVALAKESYCPSR